jgi:hypothetical protein
MRIAIPDDYQDIVHRLKCFKLLRGHEVARLAEHENFELYFGETFEQIARWKKSGSDPDLSFGG